MPLNFANVAQAMRPATLLTTSRMLWYAVASTAAVTAVVLSAFIHHNNFYSATVYLSRSSRSSLILGNFALLVFFLCGKIMQHIFLGPLRPIEVEQLYDRTWIFFTESLLAFTIFRDEFDVAFGAMFALLLFVKCFHWLMHDRVEWECLLFPSRMDTIPYPGADTLFHVRFLALFSFLWVLDAIMIAFAVESILTHGVGGIVLFGSEYAILMANASQCLSKWAIFSYDQHRARQAGGEEAPVWENKTVYIFYVELVADFFKLIIYMAFFLLVMAFYSFPLNIIRDVYMTARSFYLKARQLMRYRAATKNMEQRYPNATETEITELSDKTCIICREEMSLAAADDPRPGGPNVTPKKLPCGHIFHFHCLRSWLERQQSCPTCRRNVLETTLAVPPPANPAPRLQPAAGQANGNRDDFFRQLVELPPLVPGQIAQGPPPNQERQSTPTPTSTQPSSSQQREPLRPPPQFRGFNGRDGEWHTWDQGEHSSMNTPQAAEEPLVDTSGEGDLSSSDSPTDLTSETPRESAREAAARAALRRFQSGSSTAHERAVRRPDPLDQASRSLSPRNSAENTNGLTNVASSSDFSIEAQPTAHISSGPSQRSASAVPRLIPLFDPFVNNQLPTRTISSLPPSITPEQLARLDVVSREAIDERLRILDGVQAALWRSAEELLKLKSVLPSPQLPMPSNTTRQPQHGHLPNVDTEEERRNEQ